MEKCSTLESHCPLVDCPKEDILRGDGGTAMMYADEEHAVFRYEASPDRHGVIDGRELAAKLMEDAFSLLVPYAKNCRACAISLFTGLGDRVIFELLNERRVKELICSYSGET